MVTDLTPKRIHRSGSIVVTDDGRDLELAKSHTPHDRIVIESADRHNALIALMLAQNVEPFDKRCADALADEVDVLVRRKVIDSRSPAADALLSYRDPPTSERSDRLLQLEHTKNLAYKERNQCVAAMAKMAVMLGWRAGLGRHEESDATWESDWMNIVFIDTPKGQVSWHIHDSELPLFDWLPPYTRAWDGHDTPAKYARLAGLGRKHSTLQDLCVAHIKQTLASYDGNKTHAARALGVDRRTIYRWLEGGAPPGQRRRDRGKGGRSGRGEK